MKTAKCKECNKNERAPGRSRCYPCYGARRRGAPKYNHTNPSDMKVLFVDIETQPNLGYFWDIWNQNIGINQLVDSVEMMCFAAKWYGDDQVMFWHNRDDRQGMIAAAHKLLDEADVLVHFYGSKFDVPHFNREFLLNGFPPPSPYKQIDLKMVCSKKFKFTSNKLQYISTQLGLPGKEEHEGFPLWEKCMKGDLEAWSRMESYNRQDVVLLEEVYEILLPWITNHPHRHLYDGYSGCPNCGHSQTLQPSGYAYTKLSKFRQYKCDNCSSFFRDARRLEGVTIQESVL